MKNQTASIMAGKRALSLISAALLCLCFFIVDTQPAAAATRTVSISVGDWNCRTGGEYKGSVSKVLIDAVPSNSPAADWVSGRTRSGVEVTYNPSGSAVKIAAVAYCKTGWFTGYYVELSNGRWVTSSWPTSDSWTI